MLKVYVDLMSQPSRALYIFMKHTKIPHTVVPVALRKGEHLGEEYRKVNPFHQVPAIDDDGTLLNESVAILTYLCTKHNITHLYPQDDLLKKAKIDAFNHWQHLNLRIAGAYIFRGLVLGPAMGQPVDSEGIKSGTKILKASLNKMENIFLKDTPFVYSDHMTIADLLGVCELMQPKLGVGVDVETGYPKVTKWISNVRDTVGPDLFDEAHKYIQMAQKVAQAQASGFPTPKL